jgi:hypothetical protein
MDIPVALSTMEIKIIAPGIRSATRLNKVTLIRNPANRSNDFSRYFDFAGKRKVSPLLNSTSLPSRLKVVPFSAQKVVPQDQLPNQFISPINGAH